MGEAPEELAATSDVNGTCHHASVTHKSSSRTTACRSFLLVSTVLLVLAPAIPSGCPGRQASVARPAPSQQVLGSPLKRQKDSQSRTTYNSLTLYPSDRINYIASFPLNAALYCQEALIVQTDIAIGPDRCPRQPNNHSNGY